MGPDIIRGTRVRERLRRLALDDLVTLSQVVEASGRTASDVEEAMSNIERTTPE